MLAISNAGWFLSAGAYNLSASFGWLLVQGTCCLRRLVSKPMAILSGGDIIVACLLVRMLIA